MFRYYFARISCGVLSVAMALCMALMIFGSVFLVLFQNDAFLTRCFYTEKDGVIAMADSTLADASEELGLERDAMKGSLNDGNIGSVLAVLIDALRSGKSADLSTSADIYNGIVHQLGSYEDGTLSTAEINQYASYGVECVNEALGGETTAGVTVFRYAHSKLLLMAIVGSLAVIGVGILLIELFNDGRHRRYNYYGMSLETGGALLLLVPLYLKNKNAAGAYTFVTAAAYDSAVKSGLNIIAKISMAIGAVLLLAGLVMLIVNYNYYRKRNLEIRARKERTIDEQETFLENDLPAAKTITRDENGEFEKEILRIEFDE